MKRLVLLLVCLGFWTCSPESEFLNSTQKRQVTELTESRYQAMATELDSLCSLLQDSLRPLLIDSLLEQRRLEMNEKLKQ